MNSRQRVIATLQGTHSDRRAFAPVLSQYGARLTECPLDIYYSNPKEYADGQSAVLETFRPDILVGPFAFPLEGKAFGSQVTFFQNQSPGLKGPILKNAQEIRRLSSPDPDSHPVLLFFREAIRLMVKEHGEDVPIAPLALSPIDLPAMLLGIENWISILLFEPDNARKILDLTVPYFIKWANILFDEGAFALITPTGFANASILTREIADDLAMPPLRAAFSEVKGPVIVHSTGININPFIDLFAGLPNVAAIVINDRDDLEEARKKVGDKITLLGNIDGPSMLRKPLDDIVDKCMDALRNRKDDPCFILFSSGPDIPFETPAENIQALRRAVEMSSEAIDNI